MFGLEKRNNFWFFFTLCLYISSGIKNATKEAANDNPLVQDVKSSFLSFKKKKKNTEGKNKQKNMCWRSRRRLSPWVHISLILRHISSMDLEGIQARWSSRALPHSGRTDAVPGY